MLQRGGQEVIMIIVIMIVIARTTTTMMIKINKDSDDEKYNDFSDHDVDSDRGKVMRFSNDNDDEN